MNKILILFISLSLILGIPESFDWRTIIKQFREPSSFSSNWSFLSLTLLESYYQKNKLSYIKLSEQMLLDCDTSTYGSIENTLKWIKQNGIMKEEDYANTGSNGCKKDPSKYIDMKVTAYRKLGFGFNKYSPADEEEMKKILIEKGPIIIGINSYPLSSYVDGIIDLSYSQCPPNNINHQALLIGYGTENDIDYWIIKNSWGETWGENGYFRVRRGKGVCGINYYSIVADVKFE